jgi:outer membrane murein-binding lipoprotein Lpp
MSDTIDLKAPEVQAAIQAAVDAAVSPLIAKRDELLNEVKTLRKGKQISPEDVEKLEAQIETLQGDLSKVQGELKTAKKTAEDATKALNSESGFTQKLLVENGLTEAFMKAGVTDQDYIDLLKAKHAGLAKVVVDGDNRKVMFGDKDMETYLSEWKTTESAKKFITAPNNTGGGSQGGNGGGNTKTITRAQHDAMAPEARSAFFKEGGKLTD